MFLPQPARSPKATPTPPTFPPFRCATKQCRCRTCPECVTCQYGFHTPSTWVHHTPKCDKCGHARCSTVAPPPPRDDPPIIA